MELSKGAIQQFFMERSCHVWCCMKRCDLRVWTFRTASLRPSGPTSSNTLKGTAESLSNWNISIPHQWRTPAVLDNLSTHEQGHLPFKCTNMCRLIIKKGNTKHQSQELVSGVSTVSFKHLWSLQRASCFMIFRQSWQSSHNISWTECVVEACVSFPSRSHPTLTVSDTNGPQSIPC